MQIPESAEQVILVDDFDQEIGTEGKFEAHLNPHRHRAFSIFIYNMQGQLLVQRRAMCKYHSKGLWANTCCGHPRPHEDVKIAANRRLFEELGFEAPLTFLQTVKYDVTLDNDMREKELTHIFHGVYDGFFMPNPDQITEIKWIDPHELRQDMEERPEKYAAWFLYYVQNHFEDVFLPKVDLSAAA